MKRSLIGAVAGALVTASLSVVALAGPASAAIAATEGFDAVLTNGWTAVNNSYPLGTESVYQGLDPLALGQFSAQAGLPTSYAAMGYKSTLSRGTISTWMISPKYTSLSNGDQMTFWTRKRSLLPGDTDYPDRLEVRVSTNGSCSPGSTATSVGSFTTALLTINPTLAVGGYPTDWQQYTATLSGVTGTASGCFAFRYYITDGGSSGVNGDYIAIDSFAYDDIPTDLVPPDTTILSGPEPETVLTTRSASFTFSSDEDGTYECALDAGAFVPCATPYTATGVADGAHVLAVRALDAAGNADPTPATYAFAVDASPPGAAFTGGPASGSTINQASASFPFGASEAAVFECSVDGAPFSLCTSPLVVEGPDATEGAHTVAVRGTDLLGNADAVAASRSFTIDLTAPDTTITSGPSDDAVTASRTPRFTFSASEPGVTYACSLDGATFTACSGPGAAHTTARLSAGQHTFAVRSTDAGGNVDATPATATFTMVPPVIDCTPQGTAVTQAAAAASSATAKVAVAKKKLKAAKKSRSKAKKKKATKALAKARANANAAQATLAATQKALASCQAAKAAA